MSYVQPTIQDFNEILKDFTPIQLNGTIEIVLAKRVDVDNLPLSLRVYTSLNPDGMGRECGADAIRVEVYAKTPEGFKRVGGGKRINRTTNWKQRLQAQIETWKETLGCACNKCGYHTVERNGQNGKFFGCCRYPACK